MMLLVLLRLVAGGPQLLSGQGLRVDLEHSGVGYPVYRIPALAVTNRGTLIGAYAGRLWSDFTGPSTRRVPTVTITAPAGR